MDVFMFQECTLMNNVLKYLQLLAFVNVFLLTMYYRPESVVEVFVLATTITSFVISIMYLATDQYLNMYTVRKFVRKISKSNFYKFYLEVKQFFSLRFKTFSFVNFVNQDAGIHSVMGIIMICVSTTFLLIIEENDRMCYRDACFENHAFRILCGVSGKLNLYTIKP